MFKKTEFVKDHYMKLTDELFEETKGLRKERDDLNKAITILFDASSNWYEFVSEKDASLVLKCVNNAAEKR